MILKNNMSEENSENNNVSDEIDNDGYERSGSEITLEVEETMLKEIKKINKSTKKTQIMLESFMGENVGPMPLIHTVSSSGSSESPRIIASPRVMNQDLANMKARLDVLEKSQREIISKMNSEFISILNRTNDELALQSAAIADIQEQLQCILKEIKK